METFKILDSTGAERGTLTLEAPLSPPTDNPEVRLSAYDIPIRVVLHPLSNVPSELNSFEVWGCYSERGAPVPTDLLLVREDGAAVSTSESSGADLYMLYFTELHTAALPIPDKTTVRKVEPLPPGLNRIVVVGGKCEITVDMAPEVTEVAL